MKRRTALGALAGAAAGLAGCGDSSDPGEALLRWPALALVDLDDRPAPMAAAGSRPRIVNCWALWCEPCRRELPALQRLAADLAPQGIDVRAIALADESFALREYLARHAAGLASLRISPRAQSVGLLGLSVLPQTFFVAPDGRVLARWLGARDWDFPPVRRRIEQLLERA